MKAPKWKPAAGSWHTWHSWSSIRSTELSCKMIINGKNYKLKMLPTCSCFKESEVRFMLLADWGQIISHWRLQLSNWAASLPGWLPGWGVTRSGHCLTSPNIAGQLQSRVTVSATAAWSRCSALPSSQSDFSDVVGFFFVSCIQICWPHQPDKSESRCQVFKRFLRLITISIHLYYTNLLSWHSIHVL